MTQNKIPTDEEILRTWWEGNENVDGSNPFPEGTDWRKDDYLHLMAQARAAGREEQREKDAEIAESYSPGRTDPAKRDLCYDIAGAIRSPSRRAQGEK